MQIEEKLIGELKNTNKFAYITDELVNRSALEPLYNSPHIVAKEYLIKEDHNYNIPIKYEVPYYITSISFDGTFLDNFRAAIVNAEGHTIIDLTNNMNIYMYGGISTFIPASPNIYLRINNFSGSFSIEYTGYSHPEKGRAEYKTDKVINALYYHNVEPIPDSLIYGLLIINNRADTSIVDIETKEESFRYRDRDDESHLMYIGAIDDGTFSAKHIHMLVLPHPATIDNLNIKYIKIDNRYRYTLQQIIRNNNFRFIQWKTLNFHNNIIS
jgi:hypothetical protein